VLSAKVLDPQFQGQIKERLNSRDALRLVSSFVKPALELWLNATSSGARSWPSWPSRPRRRASAPARRWKSARAAAWPCCPAS
jgi:topoisomerase-4 subunit B